MIGSLAVPAVAVAFVVMVLTQQAAFENTEAQTQPLEFLLRDLTTPVALTFVLGLMATALILFLSGAYAFWGGSFVSLDRQRGDVVTWRRFFFRFRRQRYPLKLFEHVTIDRVFRPFGGDLGAGFVKCSSVRLEGPTFRMQERTRARGVAGCMQRHRPDNPKGRSMDINEFKDKLAAGTMTRRDLNKALAAVGLAAVTMPMVPGRASAEEQAIYFTWSGYDIPELYPEYIEKHGGAPETPLFADNEETFQKMRAGFQVDVAHPCSFHTNRWRDAGLIQEIDASRLSNWGDVFPNLKTLKNTQFDGEQWFVPFDWGQTSITYRTDIVEIEGEESWSLLWDKRYKGRLAMMDDAEDAWWCTAIYAGVDVDNVTDDDFATVRALPEKQRPLLRLYNNDMTTVEQALASGELVAAMTWNSSPLELTNQGLPVRFMNPKEGALTWLCGMVLAAGAPHYDKAHDVIDALIAPEPGIFLIEEYGYGHSNMKAFEAVDEDVLLARGFSKDPLSIIEAGIFIPTVAPDINTAIERDWSEIKAGF